MKEVESLYKDRLCSKPWDSFACTVVLYFMELSRPQ